MNKAFPVKDNQKHLSEAIVDFFATAEAFDFRQIDVQKRVTDEKNHGRLETRRALLVTNVSWMDKPMRALWTKQGGVGMLESIQEIKGKQRVERHYFIVSVGIKTVALFADAVRAHWCVEAMHWVLEVTFQEDDYRVRKSDAARNLSAIRKFALSALRLNKRHPERSLHYWHAGQDGLLVILKGIEKRDAASQAFATSQETAS
ncbi:MAG: ISAs1 family transposase [Azonexus sp.]|nr:ISAs1 family transposase [Azonexus sp.]MDP3636209.1 ISAs1 family transposase [Azonexus sp.]MDZ4315361.1 ISAs1 family transposase [Azonexus sp.]